MQLLILLVTALSLTSVQGRDSTPDLPSPWLTVDRGTKVLHLKCKPPPRHDWEAVHDLRITAFVHHRSMSSNISLVNMTSNMAEPKVNDLFPDHSVSFQGDWSTTEVSLDFAFSFTDQDLGHFFCTVDYTNKNHQHSKLASEIVVDQSFESNHLDNQPKTVGGFSAEIFDTHRVHVTWKKPSGGKFTEATVSRRFVDSEGRDAEPSFSLYATTGLRHFQYTSAVVLSRFNAHDSDNVSVTLYVQRGDHNPHVLSYRYSCRVPYPACHQDHELSCTCCQRAGSPDIEICPTSSEDTCPTCSSKVSDWCYIVLVLFVVSFIVILVMLTAFGIFKAGRCRDNSRFQNVFTPKRQSVEEDCDISSERAPLRNTVPEKPCQDSRQVAQGDRTDVASENHSGFSAQPNVSASSDNESKNNDRTLSVSKPKPLSSPPPRSKSKEGKGLDQSGIVSLPPKNSSPHLDHEDFTGVLGAEGGSVAEVRGKKSALAMRNLSHSPGGDNALLHSDDTDSTEPQNTGGGGGEETRACLEQESDISLNRLRQHRSEPANNVSKHHAKLGEDLG